MLQTMLDITVYACVIFAAILLLRAVLGKRLSPVLRYALWFVLLLRLALPFTLDSRFRLFTLPQVTAPAVAQPTSGALTHPEEVGMPVKDASPEAAAPSAAPPLSETADPAPARLSREDAVLIVWGTGAVVCGAWFVSGYAALRRRIRRKGASPSEQLAALFRKTAADMRIRSRVRLVCLYEYGTPALLFPRIILMPMDALALMDREQTELALRHELTHLRRGDQVVRIVLSLLTAVWWFNPVVWVAAHLMRQDMETACDCMVTRQLTRTQRRAYASLILELFARPKHRQIALGMAGSTRRAAEKRIRGIFTRRRSGLGARLVCVASVAALLFGCFTTACVPQRQTSEPVSAADASAVPEADAQTGALPSEWQDTLEWESGGKTWRVVIDADVDVPGTFTPAVYRVAMLSRDAFERRTGELASAFVGTLSLLAESPGANRETMEMMAEELDAMLAMTEAELDAVENGLTHETVQERLSQISRWLEDTAGMDEAPVPVGVGLVQDADEPEWYLFEAYQPAADGKNDVCFDVMYREPGDNASIRVSLRNANAGGVLLPAMGMGTAQEEALAVCARLGLGEYCVQSIVEDVPAVNEPVGAARKVARMDLRPVYGGLSAFAGYNSVYLDCAPEGVTHLSLRDVMDITPVLTSLPLRPFAEVREAFLRDAPQTELLQTPRAWDASETNWRISRVALQLIGYEAADGSTLLIPGWVLYGAQEVEEDDPLAGGEVGACMLIPAVDVDALGF